MEIYNINIQIIVNRVIEIYKYNVNGITYGILEKALTIKKNSSQYYKFICGEETAQMILIFMIIHDRNSLLCPIMMMMMMTDYDNKQKYIK